MISDYVSSWLVECGGDRKLWTVGDRLHYWVLGNPDPDFSIPRSAGAGLPGLVEADKLWIT
ncbi:MAG: hypothetical protein F6K19_45960 [Cyanothece sp. SIO1E1]|nr:hypothetical protein [Cyanothece sp. SIO1E1]